MRRGSSILLWLRADDLNRTKEYEAQAQRNSLREGASSKEEFLQSLGIVCSFISALDAPLARTVQLLAKTNQFNLTTRRHSAAEVERFATEPGGQAVAVRVRDRFGDAGVVGVALARQQGDRLLDRFVVAFVPCDWSWNRDCVAFLYRTKEL